jgi:hypothetical protein
MRGRVRTIIILNFSIDKKKKKSIIEKSGEFEFY